MAASLKYYPFYFAPDLDPSWETNPGVIVNAADMVPGKAGGLRSWALTEIDPGATYATTTAKGTPLHGTYYYNSGVVIGTTTRLLYWQRINLLGAFDVSKSGTDYTATSDWNFAQRGVKLFAASITNPTQVWSGSGAFANLGGSPPKASHVVAQKNFLILADTDDGTRANDQVWWSGVGNDATWAPSLSTQAGTALLRDTPGAITALYPLRDAVIAYKANSIYVGQYTGISPDFWSWRCISHNVGCAASHGVAQFSDAHYFLHPSGAYRFDGANLQAVATQATEFVRAQLLFTNEQYASIKAVVDETTGLICWFWNPYAPVLANLIQTGIAYNVFSGRMGLANALEPTLGPMLCTVNISAVDLGAFYGTTGYRSMLFVGAKTNGNITFALAPLWATNANSYVQTGDLGNDVVKTLLRRIQPRFITNGGTAAIFGGSARKTKESSAVDYNNADTVAMVVDPTRYRFDPQATAKFHRFALGVSNCEVMGVWVDAVPAGTD